MSAYLFPTITHDFIATPGCESHEISDGSNWENSVQTQRSGQGVDDLVISSHGILLNNNLSPYLQPLHALIEMPLGESKCDCHTSLHMSNCMTESC